jgi:fructuronate reductase
LKMRVLNAAQTTLACLGLLLGHTYTFEAVADPLLAAFVRRMLAEETLATLAPVPGIDPHAYVEQSLARLSNTAIRHRNHQIATDGSQKIVQRLLNPLGERLRHGQASAFLPVAAAASIAYLVLAAPRFGGRWAADDPFAERIATIADRAGGALPDLTAAVLGIEAIFDPRLAADAGVRVSIEQALAGLLSGNPRAYLETMMAEASVPG